MATVETIRFKDLCIDAGDPEVLAAFWAPALGLRAVSSDGDFRLVDDAPEHTLWINKVPEWIDGAPGMPWPMVFQWVPEPKTVKNRVHWDVWGETQSILSAGGSLLRRRDDEIGWDVLADPEGNEFCVFIRREI